MVTLAFTLLYATSRSSFVASMMSKVSFTAKFVSKFSLKDLAGAFCWCSWYSLGELLHSSAALWFCIQSTFSFFEVGFLCKFGVWDVHGSHWWFSGELLMNCSKLALVPRALSYLADVFLFWAISLLFLPGVGRFSLCISAWLSVFILQHHYAVYGRFLGMFSAYLVLLMPSKWLVSKLQPLEGFLSCRCHKHDLEYLFASLFVKYCDVV